MPSRAIRQFGVLEMVTNEKKMTIGGSWLLLTLLMIGMSWSAAVAPATDTLQTPETENAEDTEGDPLSLPGEIESPGDNNEFGYHRSTSIFREIAPNSAARICELLAEAGDEWANGREQEDDISFAVYKFLGETSKDESEFADAGQDRT